MLFCYVWLDYSTGTNKQPNKIIKQCSLSAIDEAKENKFSDREDYEYFYIKCLRANGLEIGAKANWKLDR